MQPNRDVPQWWHWEEMLGGGALCSQQAWPKENPYEDLLTSLTDIFKLSIISMPFCNPSKASPLEG